MNVYDLDGTILDGDSEYYFFKYAFKNLNIPFRYKLKYEWNYFLHKVFKVSSNVTRPKQYAFLKCINDIDQVLEVFWDEHMKYIKQWYLDVKAPTDVISTASPEFLEVPLCKRLGVNLIGTKMDKKTGKRYSLFNFDVEKVKSFKKVYGDVIPDKFYSDSLTDLPMAMYAKEAYFVKGNEITKWK